MTAPVPFPALSTAERDRRWAIAQRLIEQHDLKALLVYGEPEGSGVPHVAADNYFTNERTGAVVLILGGQPPLLLVPVHLAVGEHLEAQSDGSGSWLAPEQLVAAGDELPAGAGRGGGRIATELAAHGLTRGRIGVIGTGATAFQHGGIMPAGTWKQLLHRLPNVDWIPIDDDFRAAIRCRSAEEQHLLRWCARAGEQMCAAMLDVAEAGVADTDVYAAGIAASLRAGAHNSGSVLVLGSDGESVAWGPPRWTYRGGRPRVLAAGDILMAELFPVYGMIETQQQLALTIGDPHPDTVGAATAARAAYEAGVAAIRPGATFGAVVAAMSEPVREVGGWNLTPMVHALNPLDAFGGCGFPDGPDPALARYGPVGGVPTVGAERVLAPGMSLALEPNCVLGRRRANLGGTVLVTEHGADELNTLPCTIHQR
ncbi:M24 family metallopeptidase [Actinocatenispora comari]|uniref:Putative peptidase n=1 Tax=Actinocatenispora comari TaxID=2807577 RepID=A0A8J4A951_9ACTN|nr:M24 family metallopeptidase [Actinocatenispora comari]GIL25392.1 putative peptidase [Actinocatenispora comari]